MIQFIQADATALPLADQSVDLVIGSPPYTDARTYGIGAQRGCREWVDWMLPVVTESLRVSKGLVLFVVGGVTREKCYLPACEGLLWEWWSRGGHCFRPVIWHKVDPVTRGGCATPGSGGKQWLRSDWEYVMAFKRPGDLPFADNTACGHPPKYGPGGAFSSRNADGVRANDPWGKGDRGNGLCGRRADGTKKLGNRRMRQPDGHLEEQRYAPPKLSNPGDFLETEWPELVEARVGGGHMGHDDAHKGEAPYPLGVPEFFIKSFAPPGGLVLDPFGGTGSTAHAAFINGRSCLSIDIRESQCELGRRRLASIPEPAKQAELFA